MITVIIISIVFVVFRFTLPFEGVINKADIFKDMAHLWVGFTFGLGTTNRKYLYLGVLLTILEVIAFKYHQR